MNVSEFDLIIQKFIEASIQSFKKVNYSDQSDIEEHNQSVECYRKIAKRIELNYSDRRSDFSELLDYKHEYVRLCCAVCMIELMNCSVEQNKRAVETVQKYADSRNGCLEKLGLNMWLKKVKM